MIEADKMTASEREELTRQIERETKNAQRQSANRARYYARKAEGVCVCCGKRAAAEGFTKCTFCIKRRQELKAARQDKKLIFNGKDRKHKPTHSISEVNRMAAERGISYGMMVLELQKGLRE